MEVTFKYEDYLIKKGAYIEQKRDDMQKTKHQKELSECSFKPKIIGPTKHYPLKERKSPIARTVEISQNRDPKDKFKKIIGKSTHELEFEKGKQECTFKPNMRKSQTSFSTTNNQSKRAPTPN
jgi:hypothetical protein